MPKTPFFEPVCLKSEDPEGVDIFDLEQAVHFLRGWPSDRRGPVYQAAYKACIAARDGHLTVEEARRSLSGFARITGILKPEMSRPLAAAGQDGPTQVRRLSH